MEDLYKIYQKKVDAYNKAVNVLFEAEKNYKANKTKTNKEALCKATIDKNTAFLEVLNALKSLDFDTWLENQPEGTFIQGGGIE